MIHPQRILLPGTLLAGVAAAAMSISHQADASDDSAALIAPGPDVIVGDIHDRLGYGMVGNQSAFSFGTTSCNIGTQQLAWIAGTNQHPVIGQNLYRLKDGKMEMIGMSWLKHGFFALSQNLCGQCQGTSGSALGIGCSDPYSASLNGFQSDLGARSEVNAYSGVFPYPPLLDPPNPNLLSRRLIVDNDDIDPALNPGARYFVEGHYIHPEDNIPNGNGWNNMSYREVSFTGSGPFSVNFVGSTVRETPALMAWTSDPNVTVVERQLPNDGSVLIGYNVTANPQGGWDYVYTVYNRDSDRSVNGFAVPLSNNTQLSNKYYRDVDHHSGENPDDTDWNAYDVMLGSQRVIAWATQSYNNNVDANAIRWGTSFTFGFHADSPPVMSHVAIRPFKPGQGGRFYLPAMVPQ